jgi:hypothetical protein
VPLLADKRASWEHAMRSNVEAAADRLVILLLSASCVTSADGDPRLVDAVRHQDRAAARTLALSLGARQSITIRNPPPGIDRRVRSACGRRGRAHPPIQAAPSSPTLSLIVVS